MGALAVGDSTAMHGWLLVRIAQGHGPVCQNG